MVGDDVPVDAPRRAARRVAVPETRPPPLPDEHVPGHVHGRRCAGVVVQGRSVSHPPASEAARGQTHPRSGGKLLSHLLHALDVFVDHLRSIGWSALGAAAALHLGKMVVPDTRVAEHPRGRSTRMPARAVAQRVRVVRPRALRSTPLLPARGGDVLKLYLIRQRIAGPDLRDARRDAGGRHALRLRRLGGAPRPRALRLGVLPGLDVLPRLRAIDWSWAERHPAALRSPWARSCSSPRSSRPSGHDGCASTGSRSSCEPAAGSCNAPGSICAGSRPGRHSTGHCASARSTSCCVHSEFPRRCTTPCSCR